MTVNPVAVIRYQYDNHLGSASLELDENADIISYEEYHPFGTTSYRSGRTETETSQKNYKYVGKERDEETGLYYYGFRYYAAWICRFVSVDPLQFEYPQLTPFNYAGNKPITHIDIDGLQSSGDEERNSATTHIVQKGDTFWDLAQRSEGAYSIEDLKKWNPNVDPKQLQIGQKINIPSELRLSGDYQEILGDNKLQNIVSFEQDYKSFEYVETELEIFTGMASSGGGAIAGFGWNQIKIQPGRDGKISGYWEDYIKVNLSGFQFVAPAGIELISASGGNLRINQKYLNEMKTNSLTRILNRATHLEFTSGQGGIKYTKVRATYLFSDEVVWEMNLWGFGIGIGVSHSATENIDWRTGVNMTRQDSIATATRKESKYKNEFSKYLNKSK